LKIQENLLGVIMTKAKQGTPVMRQFWEVKKNNPNSILLFRMGDFYETFEEDAKIASKILGITLTKRSNGAASDVPLAGFPYHALEQYLHKLLKSGHRVAICEQVEDPKASKGIVKREVTEIVSPGVSLSNNYLEQGENNYLASIVFGKKEIAISILDFSTGEFFGYSINSKNLKNTINQYGINELIVSDSQYREYKELLDSMNIMISKVENWYLDVKIASDYLKEHFKVHSLKGFGIDDKPLLIKSAAFAINYVNNNYNKKTHHITSYKKKTTDNYMILDSYTIKNLEIFESLSSGDKKGTLINVLDRTVSAGGSRLFKKWILQPLTKIEDINKRLDRVEEFLCNSNIRNSIIELINDCSDIERIVSKISANKSNPREILSLAHSINILDSIKNQICSKKLKNNKELLESVKDISSITNKILSTIDEDAPSNYLKGGFIKDNINEDLDEYRKVSTDGTQWLVDYQKDIELKTKINKIKIGYNRVFGYYIEVSKGSVSKVPDYFIRKQTLANAERYFTEELKEYENKILNAQENIVSIELDILSDLRIEILTKIKDIIYNAKIISMIDVATSISKISEKRNYVRPNLNNKKSLFMEGARHPVIEHLLSIEDDFIDNTLDVSKDKKQVSIITGPNMSGKSTFLRQVGIIVILAQSGCYVPCQKAQISIIDRLFTRVGASDNLSSGESTFLVEMNETANILNNLTNRSLILLDEIGRGTSTYDGLSIAWSITEYLHNSKYLPITLFATHYHELIDLANKLDRANNYSVDVKEHNEDVIFLRKIIKGGTNKSYGIHVAKMAGIPNNVLKRASEILNNLSKDNLSSNFESINSQNTNEKENTTINNEIIERLKLIDVNNITPFEALIKLNELVDDIN
tara:strand:+ start:6786 stop:9404 length:2619 start_codon:yes stop_codon:yes gene_type:complete